MADTPALLLTRAHRMAQARVGAATVQALLAAFKVLNPEALDATVADWLRVATPIVQKQRATSSLIAANYVTTLRNIELPAAKPIVAVLADTVDADTVARSLVVTGPGGIKRAMTAGRTLEKATEVAMAATARSGMRLALNGGRTTVIRTVEADDRAIGYVRVTSGSPCAFCAMLASRGAVYKTEMASEMAATGRRVRGTRQPGDKYHDGCHCTAKPVFTPDDPQLDEAERFRELWAESTAGYGGVDALNAFRRALAKTA